MQYRKPVKVESTYPRPELQLPVNAESLLPVWQRVVLHGWEYLMFIVLIGTVFIGAAAVFQVGKAWNPADPWEGYFRLIVGFIGLSVFFARRRDKSWALVVAFFYACITALTAWPKYADSKEPVRELYLIALLLSVPAAWVYWQLLGLRKQTVGDTLRD